MASVTSGFTQPNMLWLKPGIYNYINIHKINHAEM